MAEPVPIVAVPNTIQTAKLMGLSKGEEERMRNQLRKHALQQCHDMVMEYIHCTQSLGFKLPLCKPLAKKMNECVKQYTRTEDMDRLRKSYLQERIAKRKQILQERIDQRKQQQQQQRSTASSESS